MRAALLAPQAESLLGFRIDGKPELLREIELLHRCGCRKIHLFLPQEPSPTAIPDSPFLSKHRLPAEEWAAAICSLLQEKETGGILLMQAGCVVQEEELLLFLQQCGGLAPGNYIGIAPIPELPQTEETLPLVRLEKKRMRLGGFCAPKGGNRPDNGEETALFAGLSYWLPETALHLSAKSAALFANGTATNREIMQAIEILAPQLPEGFAAYPFSRAIQLGKKEQSEEAGLLLQAPFPLLLIMPGKSTDGKQESDTALFRDIANELRRRNQPVICSTEAHFADLPFFFPLCFYAGDNPEIREILDIFREEGCTVLTPADLQLEDYLPMAKTPAEAIAKSLIDSYSRLLGTWRI